MGTSKLSGNLTKFWEDTCDGLASILSRRSSNTPSHFMLREPGQAPAVKWATRLVRLNLNAGLI